MMGDDLTVVNAARVSFNKRSDWVEVDSRSLDGDGQMIIYKQLSDRDRRLINYLAKHNHWTPFSHVMIQMRETVPVFVARQRFKHMVGFTYNEVSRRYDDSSPTFFEPDIWRAAAENAKQGSGGPHHDQDFWKDRIARHHMDCALLYEAMIEQGIAPEQARMVLPQSMYTSYYVTGSLAAWARAYKQRIDEHAQKEIQDLASQWGSIIGSIETLNHSWAALTQSTN